MNQNTVKPKLSVPDKPFTDEDSYLVKLPAAKKQKLTDELIKLLESGVINRNKRLLRYYTIDRILSTWIRHSETDSKRLSKEAVDGKQVGVIGNLPLMASHLDDLTAFFVETLAPQSNPFMTSKVSPELAEIVKRLGRDVTARNYYMEAMLAVKSYLKYNVGGFHVSWDEGITGSSSYGLNAAGNSYKSLSMHNTLWDDSVVDPSRVSIEARWAAMVTTINETTLLRRIRRFKFIGVEDALRDHKKAESGRALRIWVDPARALPTELGEDGLTLNAVEPMDWSLLGLGTADSEVLESDNHELTTMYCWIRPEEYDWLEAAEKNSLVQAGNDPETFIELWRFTLLDNKYLIHAKPHIPRSRSINSEEPLIPVFMSYLHTDDTGASQRSVMELLAPFQRTVSALYQIGVEAMRKDVYGNVYYDASMYDRSQIVGGGDTASGKFIKSKKAGVPPSNGIYVDTSGGKQAAEAFSHADRIFFMKDQLYPNQSMPAQVANIDRAVTQQVTAFVHGAQRAVRMQLRLLDSTAFLPARLETARNLYRYDNTGQALAEIPDEDLASGLGSGLESLEGERIVEAVWKLIHTVIQNPAMQQDTGQGAFSMPKMLQFLTQVQRLPFDLSSFYTQPAQEGQPPATPPVTDQTGGTQV